MFRARSLAIGIIVLLSSVAAVHAQEGTITVSGNVVDNSGAYVPGVSIDIKIKQCKCSECKDPKRCDCCPNQERAQSNGEGHYTFTVPHGTYYLYLQAGQLSGEVTLDLNEGSSLTRDLHLSGKVRVE